MGKRTTGGSASSESSRPTAVQQRRKIRQLDRQLLRLMNQRAALARELAQSDNSTATRVDADGSETSIQRLLDESDGPLSSSCLRAVFLELASGSRALTHPLRVAFLGPLYSYSHLAALRRFGESVEAAPVATIAAVFDEVSRGQSDFGLVPIENSTDGRVVDTLGRFARVSVQICGEVPLSIHHCLLGKGKRETIKEVYSKPQALSQCRDWLATHLPAARTVETASTTEAAAKAARTRTAAAVASVQAGRHYGLEVIAANIEDNPNNVTRFAVIGDYEPQRTKNDKTLLMFELHHQPGALADVMAIFKRNRLNLTWIESFPMPETRSEYLFFVELEGHKLDRSVKRALESLGAKTVRLDVLGSYPKGELTD